MIYICGDSFGVSDPAYGPCWVDLLAEKVDKPVTNLCRVCASNALVAMQADTITDADFVIVLFTASTRFETRLNGNIVPYSVNSLDYTTPFSRDQLALLKQHTTEFFDLELEIFRNKCIIEATLYNLVSKNIPFMFDQGGFEHVSYGSQGQYFGKFNQFRSKYNLWDYADTRAHRPYYHITDINIHEQISDYYAEQINKA